MRNPEYFCSLACETLKRHLDILDSDSLDVGIEIKQGKPDMQKTDIEIGLVLYPGVQMAAVLGLTDLFGVAGRFAKNWQKEQRVLKVTHWQLDDTDGRPARISTAEGEGRPCVLIVPPNLSEPLSREEAAPFVDWLIEQHLAGTLLSSVCGGAFMLAETGLLTGRPVTTHWAHAEAFRTRFPNARLDVDRLIIDDGDFVTAGGLMAWTDLGLKLVDRFLGPSVMIETARFLLLDPPGREQRYYSAFSPNLTHGDAAILRVQHWLQSTGAKETSLTALVDLAGLQERTFLRRFRKATGLTAVEYCQQLKVGKARELLQFSAMPVDTVAWEVGYGDPSAFRKIFARVTGLTPGDYRRRFYGNEAA